MIDRKRLLDDLRKLVTKLEKDLRERCEENAEVDARVRLEYDQAKEARRTAQVYKIWRDEWITQVAVAWVLGVVFVRFIEDNELIATPFIAGPGQRLDFAKEQRTAFFTRNPRLSDRECLEHVFREVAKLPAMKELYDERHNPLWALGVSGDGAKLILEQFQKTDDATGALVHDFTDPAWETRFLGDLYQDLSESARKKYALLQTPEFVEEFILDRTLDPAIAEFGLDKVRIIDPTCGSGHFLLGAFERIFKRWEEREPATNQTVLAQRALDSVYGVDLNPFAVAISRFRLLVAAMQASGVKRLADAPAFAIHLAVGDSLLHGPRFSATAGVQRHLDPAEDPLRHVYTTEDREALRKVLGQQYHAIVGNPPYITVKDKALNDAYRQKYGSCSGKYSLSVPFMERFFELAVPKTPEQVAGFVGQITSNSFMKREFGAKLIERFIPTWDLTHVVDTSGAFIPGHSTPTVILFGRNQMPASENVRAVMGIRGEPSAPDIPAEGRVWRAITVQIDQAFSTSEWLSTADVPRAGFHKHPWSIGGGGAAELKQLLESNSAETLDGIAESIGITSFTLEDDVYLLPAEAAARRGMTPRQVRLSVSGDEIRDWRVGATDVVVWPYDEEFQPISDEPADARLRYLWPARTSISSSVMFGGKTKVQTGLRWFEFGRLTVHKLKTPLSITYAEVSTHNHFVVDRGGKVFAQTAPVIKLPPHASEHDYVRLVGLLNSSVACFWLKQVAYPKGTVTGDISAVKGRPEANRYAFSAGSVADLPLPPNEKTQVILGITKLMDQLAMELAKYEPGQTLARCDEDRLSIDDLSSARETFETLWGKLVGLQEELDWACYEAYGLSASGADLHLISVQPVVLPVWRPFAWEREGRPGLPREVAERYQSRRQELEENAVLQLIETPVFKRPWLGRQGVFGHDSLTWQQRAWTALRAWLLGRIEQIARDESIISTARLSKRCAADEAFMRVAALYRDAGDFHVDALVSELATSDGIPVLPVDRYKDSGIRKREAWEQTWALQRRQDGGEQISDIPVPPKYKSSDFKSASYWSLRGKLDVPKERFISFPGCERESDSSLPILWAGYDHLQQAKAIAAYHQDLKEHEGAAPAKLGKLLACILELLPWLKQWHNEVDPEYGTKMGDFFETFMLSEMSSLGLAMDDLRKIRGL